MRFESTAIATSLRSGSKVGELQTSMQRFLNLEPFMWFNQEDDNEREV